MTLSDNQKNPALIHVVAEHRQSMKILGVPEEKVIVDKFETRRFPQDRQEILKYMIELEQEILSGYRVLPLEVLYPPGPQYRH